MMITCNRILFPPSIEEEDEIIREAKMKQMAKNIRKRKIIFHLADIEKFGEHEDLRFTEVWFYANDPIVIEYPFETLEKQYREWYEDQEDDEQTNSWQFWIPAN